MSFKTVFVYCDVYWTYALKKIKLKMSELFYHGVNLFKTEFTEMTVL